MDILILLTAFACGFIFKQVALPPLLGYLVAGFALNMVGVSPFVGLESLANIGVTLLLFTIGLKLNIRSLIKLEIWGSALSHMAVITAITSTIVLILASTGLAHFNGLSLEQCAIIAFALSFSSTVCAIKVLEDKGELKARHGQIAIGILIIQDLAAVLFLTIASQKIPTLWAIALLALPLTTPFLNQLIKRCGHGEVLALCGFALALGGSALFELTGLKGDLGAIVFGVLLSQSSKATELSKALLSFKDIFLIGFFLSIGFTAVPTGEMVIAGLVLCFLLPLKSILFFLLFTGFQLRARAAFLSSLSLGNYSEFGLIVAAISSSNGWLSKEWLVISAIAVAFSFLLSSILNVRNHSHFERWAKFLDTFERREGLPEDIFTQPTDCRVLIVGMGRVGKGAYGEMENKFPHQVYGVDVDLKRCAQQRKLGYQMLCADAENVLFWQQLKLSNIELIMFTMPSREDIEISIRAIKSQAFSGKIAAIAKYEDDRLALLDAGADIAFNLYAEAGTGFAEETMSHLPQLQLFRDTV